MAKVCWICGEETCICEKPAAAPPVFRSTWRPIPTDAISKDEFGLPLFEAIKVCGGILQLQDMQRQRKADDDPDLLADYKTRETALLRTLAEMTRKLPVNDQQDLMARYPRLFT